ncbi:MULTISPECIES: 4,5-dihydroxyphthalate decarboxylase [unclassified Streptomyces]|uniref:4,5-dihydroxyphthalate decarboxylase n=1 Tax=unclassified Streptomyces TaxID=2593676 RepID=UPI002E81C102|nr:4,5-dihydroxyphthalate decarboxylase [Streptomyces sp. NBC_00589]WTI33896.1 ABC transporter substrate-binding protein [Streptomyces sp. NBC_00775]WUB32431.1 ABC transporter substrate-binding protein [Streptomyces sp. NBC_00589]
MDKLSVVVGDYPHARALLDGTAAVAGHLVEEVEVRPVISAYRRMIRDLEFDVCELAPVSYLMARQAGVPLTAVPVFLNRRFHHGDIQCGVGSGIRIPTDLEGRRVGVRAYSVSTGVWVRGILAEEYGVDLDKITWVVDDDDHVEGHLRPNIERVTDGRSLGELLRAGEIDAAFTGNAGTGRAGTPRAGWTATADAGAAEGDAPYPLFPLGDVVAADWYLRTGTYPLHSLIALRTELVARDPGLPTALYTAFAEAKQRQLAVDPEWTALPRFARQAEQIGGDPVPYGVAANERSLAAIVRYSRDQGLLDADFPAEPRALFADGDYPDA